MATTIIRNPDPFQPCKSDSLYFIVSADTTNQPKFRYVYNVYVNDFKVFEGKATPNPFGLGIIDVSQIVDSYLQNYPISYADETPIFTHQTTPFSRPYSNEVVEYYIVVGEEYADSFIGQLTGFTGNGDNVGLPAVPSQTFKSFLSTMGVNRNSNQPSFNIGQFTLSGSPSIEFPNTENCLFLTNSPRIRDIYPNDYYTLSFTNHTLGGDYLSEPYYVKYIFFDKNGIEIEQKDYSNIISNGGGPYITCTDTVYNTPDNRNYNILNVGVGPKNIYEFPEDTSYYRVMLFGKGTPPPPPTYYSFELGYDPTNDLVACEDEPTTYFSLCEVLEVGCVLLSSTNPDIFAPIGFYSDGTDVYLIESNGVISSIFECGEEPPVIYYPVTLSYDPTDPENACVPVKNQYFSDCNLPLTVGCTLYTSTDPLITAPQGYYSNSVDVFTVDSNGEIVLIGECSTPPPPTCYNVQITNDGTPNTLTQYYVDCENGFVTTFQLQPGVTYNICARFWTEQDFVTYIVMGECTAPSIQLEEPENFSLFNIQALPEKSVIVRDCCTGQNQLQIEVSPDLNVGNTVVIDDECYEIIQIGGTGIDGNYVGEPSFSNCVECTNIYFCDTTVDRPTTIRPSVEPNTFVPFDAAPPCEEYQVVSEVFQFNLKPDCNYFENPLIMFKNRYGVWDYFRFQKYRNEGLGIERSNYGQYNTTWGSSNPQKTTYSRGLTNFYTSINETHIVNSGFLNDPEFIWLEELWTTNDAYLIDENTGKLFPINIVGTEFIRKTKGNRSITNVELTYTFSNNIKLLNN